MLDLQLSRVSRFGHVATTSRTARTQDSCGEQDEGEYIPCDEMVDKPEAEPMYVEGCQKVEFKHIINFFDFCENPKTCHNYPKNNFNFFLVYL